MDRFPTDVWTGTAFHGLVVEVQDPVAAPQAYGAWLDPVPVVPPLPPPGQSGRAGNVALDLTLANAVPWALNYGRSVPWARVTPNTWERNLGSAPVWDENSFNANHIDHPVHGGMYFTAGRVNGLGFWASAPLAPLGSAIWEYFAETNTPSLNDLVITSLGGIAVGEVTFRASELIIDDQATGLTRALREVAAFLVSPGVGIHRVVRGKSWHTSTETAALGEGRGRKAPEVEAHFAMGARSISRATGQVPVQQGLMSIDFRYGDPFSTGSWTAFQAFSFRGTVVTGQYPALTELAISGLLGRARLSGAGQNQVLVGAAFDYDVTAFPGFGFSGPGVGGVLLSRVASGPFTIDATARVAALPLSAITSEYSRELIQRPYDYGSGVGAGLGAALRHRTGIMIEARYNHSQLWAQSAAASEHQVTELAVHARVPVIAGLAAEAEYLRTGQRSIVPGVGTVSRDFPEIRVMFSTMVGSPARAARAN